jgi:hypothetical protein
MRRFQVTYVSARKAIAGTLVLVEIGAIAVHDYPHSPIERHRVGLYADHPALLPDNHEPERAPPEPSGRLITVVSSVTSTDIGPILRFGPGSWPPSST